MNNEKIVSELVRMAKGLIAAPIEYDSKTESKYSKNYDSKLRALMKKPHLSYIIESAKSVYDGVEFVNDAGVTFKLKVNTNAKKETDVVTVTASKDGQTQKKNIAPNNIPFMVG